jgi:NAD(P)-dependent dehydrogenase (short-subunit alcohol dehydrogenase family)
MKRVALITGGSRGIGLGIAHSLAKEGWNIAINGMRPQEQVQATLDELAAHGTEVIYCQGNVGTPANTAKYPG